METLYEYKADRLKDLKRFTVVDGKIVFKRKDTTVELLESANDLRYCDWGIQAIWNITISFPFGHITKTIRRTNDKDFSKAEKYINTKLKKYGFDKINIIKDSEQIGASPASYRISNIKKIGRA